MMSVLELEEFSTLENIKKLIYGDGLWSMMKDNFIEEPKISRANDIGGTCFEYEKYPIEITIHGDDSVAIHIFYNKKLTNKIKILGFIDEKTSKSDIIKNMCVPDFEIDEKKKLEMNNNCQRIKYFIDDKYSISFDHNEKIELASIFYDKYR